jgi:hypothetical protein
MFLRLSVADCARAGRERVLPLSKRTRFTTGILYSYIKTPTQYSVQYPEIRQEIVNGTVL